MNVHAEVEDVLVEVHLALLVVLVSLEGPNHAGACHCFLEEARPFFMLLVEIIDDVVGGLPDAEVQLIEDGEKNDDQQQVGRSLVDHHHQGNQEARDQAQ